MGGSGHLEFEEVKKAFQLSGREDVGPIGTRAGCGQGRHRVVVEVAQADQIAAQTEAGVPVKAQGVGPHPPLFLIEPAHQQPDIDLLGVVDALLHQEAIETAQIGGGQDNGKAQILEIVQVIAHEIGQRAFKVQWRNLFHLVPLGVVLGHLSQLGEVNLGVDQG